MNKVIRKRMKRYYLSLFMKFFKDNVHFLCGELISYAFSIHS